jgi:hypothetical protein
VPAGAGPGGAAQTIAPPQRLESATFGFAAPSERFRDLFSFAAMTLEVGTQIGFARVGRRTAHPSAQGTGNAASAASGERG